MRGRLAIAGAGLVLVACSPPPPASPAVPVKFTDVTPAVLPAGLLPPLTNEDTVSSALFADLDGDGIDELVITSDATRGAYRLEQGAWVPGAALPEFPRGLDLALVDLDGDGALETIRGSGSLWGGTDPSAAPRPLAFDGLGWYRPGNMSVADVDGDGWLDVVGGGICCGKASCRDLGIWLRTGPRTFRNLTESNGIQPGPRLKNYLAMWMPMAPEPLIMQLGEACRGDPPAADPGSPFYRLGRSESGDVLLSVTDPLPTESLFRIGDPHRSLPSVSPMGAVAADLDGDGVQDFAIGTNPMLELFRGGAGWPMALRSGGSGILRMPGERNFQLPWGMAAPDLDLDGRNDLVVAHGDDGEARTNPAAFIGPQQLGVYLNRGDFKFDDVTARLGLPSGQWRSLTVSDFDCDGDADLGLGGLNSDPRVLRNDTDAGGHALSIKLRGSTSNALGLGARLEVEPEGAAKTQALWVGGVASPLAFSEPIVFAGLGSATRASRVRVRWPSGFEQVVRDLPGGRCHVVTEPELVTITPASRHAPAGTPIQLRIQAYAPDGTAREGSIGLRLLHGDATVTTTPAPGGGRTFTLTAASAGSAELELTIDELVLSVHQRLWWD